MPRKLESLHWNRGSNFLAIRSITKSGAGVGSRMGRLRMFAAPTRLDAGHVICSQPGRLHLLRRVLGKNTQKGEKLGVTLQYIGVLSCNLEKMPESCNMYVYVCVYVQAGQEQRDTKSLSSRGPVASRSSRLHDRYESSCLSAWQRTSYRSHCRACRRGLVSARFGVDRAHYLQGKPSTSGKRGG